MRYISSVRPAREAVEAAVRAAIGHHSMAYESATGAFIGWFSLWPSAPQERELGYRLRRAMWGARH
jgi:hypothetical protein